MTENKITSPSLIKTSLFMRVLVGVLLAALSALLLMLAMPPYGIWPLAILGLLPMILAQYRILPRRVSSLASAITIGGLVGLYIMDAFLNLPGAPWYMRGLPLIFGGFVFFTDAGTRSFHERTGYRWFVLSGAAGWVGIEMIRGFIPVLGTWGFLGYSYFKQPWLIQPVSIFGIYGLTLVSLLLCYALGKLLLVYFDSHWQLDPEQEALTWQQTKKWLLGTAGAFAAWVILSLVLLQAPAERTVRVAAVQSGFENLWTENEIATRTLSNARYQEIYRSFYEILERQTNEAIGREAELIVWSEGALNVDPQIVLRKSLAALTTVGNTHLVAPYGVGTRNEVTVVDPNGAFLGVYGKNHPVIFVNEQSATFGTYPVYETAIGRLGTIICYDLDFTDTARKVARNGAQIIAVPSGDWPGIHDKHYAHVVFRAVENRVAMIKSDRSFDSAIVDPYGRIIDLVVSETPLEATLVADVSVMDARPLQRVLGDWIGWISLAGLVFFTILDPLSKARQKKQLNETDHRI